MRQGVGVDSMKVLGIQGEGWFGFRDFEGAGARCFEGPFQSPCGPMIGTQDYPVRSSLGIPKVPTGP